MDRFKGVVPGFPGHHRMFVMTAVIILCHAIHGVPRRRGVIVAGGKEIYADFLCIFPVDQPGAMKMGVAGDAVSVLPVHLGIRIAVSLFHNANSFKH